MSDDTVHAKYSIRLCHIVKWPDFDGYGFNLHAEKGKPGQYIGKVDGGSPAEAAGLKEGDRIIEVNGVNISNENHKQVVQRIKTVPDETKLLVVDTEADNYFKSKNIVIRSDLPNVVYLRTLNAQLINGNDENGTTKITTNNGSCIDLEVSSYSFNVTRFLRCIAVTCDHLFSDHHSIILEYEIDYLLLIRC
ncbi:hypothetical protein V9T40_008757 [Parthenolecanium corni]|uniref:PDZ domain-containing protein n=1 Tax=Parthenolecanium corni TaxID=536013 RepID=A0AAN9TNQ0_9HEMI